MNTQKVFVSLGPNGEQSLAIFLEMIETLAHRQVFGVADFQQILLRRPAEQATSPAFEAVLTRLTQRKREPVLCRELPELPWVDAFAKPADENRAFGFDRAGLAEKCWQEWVQCSVHDQSVPWYRQINEAIVSLRSSATRLALDPHCPIHISVIANLANPVESALAYALGRYLRGWHSADLRPVLIAVLAPREDISQVAQLARAHAVAALADICRDGQQLGYTNVSLIDGRLSASGQSVVQLTDYEVATVLGQILYATSASGLARSALYGDGRGRMRPASELSTVAAAAYSYDPRQFANYAAIRLILSGIRQPNETDTALTEKLKNTAWPQSVEAGRDGRANNSAVAARELSSHLEDLVAADMAQIVRTLNDIVERAGYKELLEQDFCQRKSVAEWPETIHDLIAVVQQGIVKPIEPVVRAAAEAHSRGLGDTMIEKIREALQQRDLDDRLIGGTAVLGSLRLLERRLPEVWRATSERLQAAEEDEATGAKDHDREIARLYEMLCREARLPPHSFAMIARAVLCGLLAATILLLTNNHWLGPLVPRFAEAAVWGALVGGLFGGVSYVWFVLLRRLSCASIVKQIRQNLDLRCKVLLNRMRLEALELYLSDIRSQMARAIGLSDASESKAASSQTTPAGRAASHSADSLGGIHQVLTDYAKSWPEQIQRVEEQAACLEQLYQRSSYLNRVPRMPAADDELAQATFQMDLDRAVAKVLQLADRTTVDAVHRFAAVQHCLAKSEVGLWKALMPDDLTALPECVPQYVKLLVERVSEALYTEYYDHISIDDLLREMPADQVRWSAGAQHANVEAALESPFDAQRENAKRGVLVEGLFNHTALPLPLAGIQAEKLIWLSASPSKDGDYLLEEPGLRRRFENSDCDFTNDRATAILLAISRGIRPVDVLEASGSLYRNLLERVRQQYPNQSELVSVPASLAGGAADEH